MYLPKDTWITAIPTDESRAMVGEKQQEREWFDLCMTKFRRCCGIGILPFKEDL